MEQKELEDLFSSSDINILKTDREHFKEAVHTFFDFENDITNSYTVHNTKRVFASELTPLSFYPLLAEGLSKAEVNLLINKLYYSEHFIKKGNDSVFLPSVSFLPKTFNGDGDYWRGRMWPPVVYLGGQGLTTV